MLQIRYHPEFKGLPTILFVGSKHEFSTLLYFFKEWNGEDIDLIQYLQSIHTKLYLFSVSIILIKQTSSEDSFKWQNQTGIWQISKPHVETIIGLIEELCETDSPGHQYLDIASDIQIIFSKDEY